MTSSYSGAAPAADAPTPGTARRRRPARRPRRGHRQEARARFHVQTVAPAVARATRFQKTRSAVSAACACQFSISAAPHRRAALCGYRASSVAALAERRPSTTAWRSPATPGASITKHCGAGVDAGQVGAATARHASSRPWFCDGRARASTLPCSSANAVASYGARRNAP